MKQITLGLLLVLATTFGLAGCNTIAGAGHDIKDAGQGIQNSADRHKPSGDQ